MTDWTELLVESGCPLRDAIRLMDQTLLQIVLVTDKNRRLLGVITDGDVRRAILRGITLEDPVHRVMNTRPITAEPSEDKKRIIKRMASRHIRHIPIVDPEGILLGVEFHPDLLTPDARENWVILMAGGLGKRLFPLTEEVPKPLLSVGDTPVLETILKNFIDFGFQNFFLSVNYKGEMIRDHFGDGSRFGAEIRYLQEMQPLGTAGALSLLPERPKKSFIVMNADLLTTLNFHHLLDFHRNRRASGTMCIREYGLQVPFGMVRLSDDKIVGIDEKPVQKFFINAGIYVLEPSVLDLVQANTPLDMPELFQRLIAREEKTIAFPIREYWTDIGQLEDFHRANGEFRKFFTEGHQNHD